MFSDLDVWMKSKNRSDYVDQWYTLLEDITFKTKFVSFTKTEAEILLSVIKYTLDPNQKKKPLADEISSAFTLFKSRIVLSFPLPPGSKFFCRLNSRSPKDAVLLTELSRLRFQKNLYTLLSAEAAQYKDLDAWLKKDLDYSDVLLSFRAEIASLCCTNVDEIFDLFVNSERIKNDLMRELKFSEPNFTLVIREWGECDPVLEFRGFVFNSNLTALTPYDNRWFDQRIVNRRSEISSAICSFFADKVRLRLAKPESPFKDGCYAVDFVVELEDEGVVRVKVIEVNQFEVTTGTSLFDYDADADILKGKKGFEFRVVQKWAIEKTDVRYWVYEHYEKYRARIKKEIVSELQKKL